MKVLVIPDVHLKPWIFSQAGKLMKDGAADRAVCLMDIADDWNKEYDLTEYFEVDSKENSSSYSLEQRVQDFLIFNHKYLPEKDLEYVASRLLNLNKSQIFDVECLPFRNVTVMYLVSIFLGVLGVDRFLLNDARNGVFKLLLFIFSFLIIPGIILLVWWLKDIIRMDTMTREFNLQLLETACDYYAIS